MKNKYSFLLVVLVALMTSCQTAAEKVSGNYSGTWSASGPGFTTSSGVGNASLSITADGSKRIDMGFSSPGNPSVNIQDIDLTDIIGVYIFNLNDNMGGTVSVSGTITQNILALSYSNTTDSVDLSLAGFSK